MLIIIPILFKSNILLSVIDPETFLIDLSVETVILIFVPALKIDLDFEISLI